MTVVLSHYLPGGQAERSPQPAETVYVLVGGELVMISEGVGGDAAPLRLRPLHRRHRARGGQPQLSCRPACSSSGRYRDRLDRRHPAGPAASSGARASHRTTVNCRQAHRPRPGGSFDATVVTFAAMGLFDSLTGDQRARVLLPHTDPGRTHWNFLPESGRHGLALGRARPPPGGAGAPADRRVDVDPGLRPRGPGDGQRARAARAQPAGVRPRRRHLPRRPRLLPHLLRPAATRHHLGLAAGRPPPVDQRHRRRRRPGQRHPVPARGRAGPLRPVPDPRRGGGRRLRPAGQPHRRPSGRRRSSTPKPPADFVTRTVATHRRRRVPRPTTASAAATR